LYKKIPTLQNAAAFSLETHKDIHHPPPPATQAVARKERRNGDNNIGAAVAEVGNTFTKMST
jgi:hypothetical protein